jgi:hypothetical protein
MAGKGHLALTMGYAPRTRVIILWPEWVWLLFLAFLGGLVCLGLAARLPWPLIKPALGKRS